MRRWLLVLWLACSACTTPLAAGERLYRDGDRQGALEVWRSVPPGHRDHAEAVRRIRAVEEEQQRLVNGYVESARRLERDGRLAEAVLDYRLALALQPDDAGTLQHVQGLVRELAARERELAGNFEQILERGDLEGAQSTLRQLRLLDPFDPHYEIEEARLETALRAEWRRRRERFRAELAGEVERLVEAGRAAFLEERLEDALDLWRRALLIDPDNERIQAYIARAERQLENLEKLRAAAAPDDAR